MLFSELESQLASLKATIKDRDDFEVVLMNPDAPEMSKICCHDFTLKVEAFDNLGEWIKQIRIK